MTLTSMLTRSACLLAGPLFVGAAIAQAPTLVTGKVFNSYTEGGAIVIELSEPNNCGSSIYVSGTSSAALSSVQEAIDGAEEIDGLVTIRHGACVSGNATIDGIAYGPDV